MSLVSFYMHAKLKKTRRFSDIFIGIRKRLWHELFKQAFFLQLFMQKFVQKFTWNFQYFFPYRKEHSWWQQNENFLRLILLWVLLLQETPGNTISETEIFPEANNNVGQLEDISEEWRAAQVSSQFFVLCIWIKGCSLAVR